MRRRWPLILLAGAVVAGPAASGCSRLNNAGVHSSTTSTIAPWTTDPEAALWGPLETLCRDVNDTSLADANRLLPVDSVATGTNLATFYRDRADQVDALVTALRIATPPTAVAAQWPAALDGLQGYATWLRSIADKVQRDGLKVDQTPPRAIEDFRALMPYGACHDLLDVN